MKKEIPFNPNLHAMIKVNGQPVRVSRMELDILQELSNSKEPVTVGDLARFWLEKYEKPITSIPWRMKIIDKKFKERIGFSPIETIRTPLEGNKTRTIKTYRIQDGLEIDLGQLED